MNQLRFVGGKIFEAGGCQITYITNPEETLDEAIREYLASTLAPAATRGFGHQVTEESIRRHALIGQDYLLLVEVAGRLAGFASARNLSERKAAVFLEGIVLSPECQGLGLGGVLFRTLLDKSRCELLAFTTQSPVIYLMLTRVSNKIYPDTREGLIPPDLQTLGTKIIYGRGGEFSPETFVLRDYYPQPLYPYFPWCKDSQVNSLFKRLLRFEEDGTRDGLLLVGKIG